MIPRPVRVMPELQRLKSEAQLNQELFTALVKEVPELGEPILTLEEANSRLKRTQKELAEKVVGFLESEALKQWPALKGELEGYLATLEKGF